MYLFILDVSDADKKMSSDLESLKTNSLANVEELVPYPKSVFFILSTEACERFSYYGMRGV